MKDTEIVAIMEEITPLLKAYYSLPEKDRKVLPDYNPVYAETVELQQEIAVHSELRDFPHKLFKDKAPNESDAQWSYRKQNYRPITLPFWNRALGVMNRVWNENNYELKWQEKDNGQSDYFLKNYPEYSRITAFFESVVTRFKVNDPNAALFVKPWYLPTVTNEQGEIVFADNKEIDAIAQIYPADKVIRFERDYAMVLTDEKSPVTEGDSTVMKGLVFDLYDDTNIWKISQTGKLTDWSFNVSIFYRHQLGYIPAKKLGGMPLDKDGNIYYKSILYDAVPLLNEALYDFSTQQLVKVGAAFPYRWVYSDRCHYMGEHGQCDNGLLTIPDGDGIKRITCPGCNGTGFTNPYSPMGLMHVRIPDNNLQSDKPIPSPPMGAEGPPVDILKWSDDMIWSMIGRAFIMQNIDVTADMPGERVSDATATGRLIDREELFSFLQLFSSEIFDLYDFAIDSIGKLRYTSAWKKPVLSKPVNFAIRSETDLTDEIAKAKQNSMPEVALRRLMLEYIGTRFTDSSMTKAITDLIMRTDTLFTYAAADINASLATGYVQKWESELHKNIVIYIEQEIEANPEFLQSKFADQRTALINRAKADVIANTPMTADAIVAKAQAA